MSNPTQGVCHCTHKRTVSGNRCTDCQGVIPERVRCASCGIVIPEVEGVVDAIYLNDKGDLACSVSCHRKHVGSPDEPKVPASVGRYVRYQGGSLT